MSLLHSSRLDLSYADHRTASNRFLLRLTASIQDIRTLHHLVVDLQSLLNSHHHLHNNPQSLSMAQHHLPKLLSLARTQPQTGPAKHVANSYALSTTPDQSFHPSIPRQSTRRLRLAPHQSLRLTRTSRLPSQDISDSPKKSTTGRRSTPAKNHCRWSQISHRPFTLLQ